MLTSVRYDSQPTILHKNLLVGGLLISVWFLRMSVVRRVQSDKVVQVKFWCLTCVVAAGEFSGLL